MPPTGYNLVSNYRLYQLQVRSTLSQLPAFYCLSINDINHETFSKCSMKINAFAWRGGEKNFLVIFGTVVPDFIQILHAILAKAGA